VPVNHSKNQLLTYASSAVIEIISNLGCVPVLLPNTVKPVEARKLIHRFDGLILSPGEDIALETTKFSGLDHVIAPETDGESRRPIGPDYARDRLEIALYNAAITSRIPILGICRGMQIINVAEGGTLHQHLMDAGRVGHNIEEDGWINYHDIRIKDKSLLRKILKADSTIISSIHHQGIDKLGDNLIACAHSDDGLIEGIELDNENTFVLGLQGHFEKGLKNQSILKNIWTAFAQAAKEHRFNA
jgi:putative glutamine amidotransferase